MNTRNLVLLTAVVIIAVFSFVIYRQADTNHTQGMGRFAEDIRAWSQLGGDFTLDTTQGKTALSDLWKDRVLLVYLGFTRCPDICPASMATMGAAIKQLDPVRRNKVQVALISADPEYDTPQLIQNYAGFFVEGAIGMHGTLSETRQFARNYGAYFHKVPLPESELGYTVDHSTRWYLIQPDGTIGTVLDHNLAPEEMAEIITVFADSVRG